LGFRNLLTDKVFVRIAAQQGARQLMAGAMRFVAPFGGRIPQKLLIAPQDIRTSDPTIATDIYAGHIKFAGKLLETHGRSPFDLPSPSDAFTVELHGFGWLRHFRAAETVLSKVSARALVADWIESYGKRPSGLIGRADVTARRLMSWLGQAPLLLDGADAAFYKIFIKALAADAQRLQRSLRATPPTELRLLIHLALTHYALSCSETDAELKNASANLCDVLDDQILADGGHISRNPAVVLNTLLDLLPLKLAFLWRRIQTPQPIVAAIDRMMPMLRMMRHADGAIALFNGMGATRADFIAAVLAQDDTMAPPPLNAPYAGYQRIEHGQSVVIIDAGISPKLPLAARAHAAPAAFEFSAEGCRIVVNCGAPPAHRLEMAPYARLTAAHSTLVVDDKTIGRFIRSRSLRALVGEQYVGGARTIDLKRATTAEGTLVTVDHDGYVKKYGALHQRKLAISIDGLRLEGEDGLKQASKVSDVPYAVRFHLHPLVKATLSLDKKEVSLVLPNRSTWHFDADGLEILLEESIFFASTDGFRRSEQIVISTTSAGHASVGWSFRKNHK
jgi:uncharacterized heparinase superfamily protein